MYYDFTSSPCMPPLQKDITHTLGLQFQKSGHRTHDPICFQTSSNTKWCPEKKNLCSLLQKSSSHSLLSKRYLRKKIDQQDPKAKRSIATLKKKKYDLKLSLGLQMCSVFDFMQAAVIEKVLLNTHLPNAQWDQTNGNVKSLEYRKVYCRVVQRQIAHASCPNPKL